MKIGFIGAGKVGTSLGKYFKQGDLEVTGYYSKNPESAKEASVFTNSMYFETLAEMVSESDIIYITVPDREIDTVWKEVRRFPIASKIICHCSGAMSSAVFSEIDKSNAFGYSIHPLLAVRSKTESYKELSQAFFTIEGHSKHMDNIRWMFTQLGNEIQVIPAEQKARYHAGAVFISNHVAALVGIGSELLVQCGFDKMQAEKVLMPLFLNNCQGIAQDGIIRALTGPVERADAGTIEKHLDVLEEEDRLLYLLLSKKLVEISKEKHENRDYRFLEQLFNEEMERCI